MKKIFILTLNSDNNIKNFIIFDNQNDLIYFYNNLGKNKFNYDIYIYNKINNEYKYDYYI